MEDRREHCHSLASNSALIPGELINDTDILIHLFFSLCCGDPLFVRQYPAYGSYDSGFWHSAFTTLKKVIMNDPLLKVKHLKKVFHTGDIQTLALADINLTLNKGEYVAITGPSGCGKTTLLSILGLLDTPTEGLYELSGQDVSNLKRNKRAQIRNRHIGFIFQSFNLISELSVLENVTLPLTYQKETNSKTRQKRALEVLHKVDMAHRRDHFPNQLSGGQQQRVAVARALVTSPDFLLADEPTGNLDSKNATRVLELLKKLNQEGTTICMVTHDPRSASAAMRNIRIMDGMVVENEAVNKLSTAISEGA
jgi:putative ABC transport system ATP-binding protein